MIDEETRAALASQVIGGAFVRGRLDREQVADLKDGRLLLRPHPVFEIPPRTDRLADPSGPRNSRAQLPMLRPPAPPSTPPSAAATAAASAPATHLPVRPRARPT